MKRCRLAFRDRHLLLLVSLRLLDHALGGARGLLRHFVVVGLSFVDGALLVGAGGLHVAERLDHRAGRIDALRFHLRDQNAGAVFVEDRLDELTRLCLDLGSALGAGEFEGSLADDLAHRRFGGAFHRLLGIADVEEELAGVVDDPEHHELDVDDVLIARQHQAFLADVAGAGRAGRVVAGAEPDLDPVDARHLGSLDMPDRRRPIVMQARRRGLDPLAEDELDPLLVRLDAVDAEGEPDDEHDQDHQKQPATGPEHAARKRAPETILALAQKLFQVRRTVAAEAATAASPGIAGPAASARPRARLRLDCSTASLLGSSNCRVGERPVQDIGSGGRRSNGLLRFARRRRRLI